MHHSCLYCRSIDSYVNEVLQACQANLVLVWFQDTEISHCHA